MAMLSVSGAASISLALIMSATRDSEEMSCDCSQSLSALNCETNSSCSSGGLLASNRPADLVMPTIILRLSLSAL